jgi:hypothetical protein
VQTTVTKTAAGILVVTAPPGRWEASDAEAAIRAIDALVVPAEQYVFVGDVTVMTGYEPPVRRMWQEWIARRGGQLRELWIAGAEVHPFVRLGIAAASAFLGRKFRFARTVAEVPGYSTAASEAAARHG